MYICIYISHKTYPERTSPKHLPILGDRSQRHPEFALKAATLLPAYNLARDSSGKPMATKHISFGAGLSGWWLGHPSEK